MKVIKISTLILITILSIGNVNSSFGKNDSEIYKNICEDESDNSSTITLYSGKNEMYLKPIKQYTVKFDKDGYLIEKIQYSWDAELYVWKVTDKYNYMYAADGKVKVLTHAEWNENTKTWIEDTEFDLYMLDIDQELLSVKENI